MSHILEILAVAVSILGFRAGLRRAREHHPDSPIEAFTKQEPGWVYFLSSIGGGEDDPPAPIKIGMTQRDPRERLPEIETMSPDRLELLHVLPTPAPRLLELRIHQELRKFRHHGEWYDRDATLAWLDNYRGDG